MNAIEKQAQDAIDWIDGLSTTEAKQCRGRLGDKSEGYCCLGYGLKRLGMPFESSAMLARGLIERVGLFSSSGEYRTLAGSTPRFDDKRRSPLTSLNDKQRRSFAEIADVLKTKAIHYFTKPVAKLIKAHYAKEAL